MKHYRNFREFWDTEIKPTLKAANLVCDIGAASVYFPKEFLPAFYEAHGGGEWHPELVYEMLFNGWRKRIENDKKNHRRVQKYGNREKFLDTLADGFSKEREILLNGILLNVEKRVEEAMRDKERKENLRKNTRLVRLTVDEISYLMDMLCDIRSDEASNIFAKLNEKLDG